MTSLSSNYIKFLIAIFSIWNLDFFRSLYPPFCLHPKLSILHILSLDYFIALYPMILIFLTYFLVKLHDRFRFVVYFCRPVYKCFHFFRKEWDIETSLIGAFATFYLLSYVRALNITSSILTGTLLYNMNDTVKESVFYYDGSMTYFGKEHRPYAVMAIIFLCLFNILPVLLLCLYPCHCFHECLNKTRCRCHALHVFMDAILGAYSHKPRERRYFGALYLFMRVIHVIGISLLQPLLYTATATYILITAVVLVAYFKPYRKKWHNVIDMVLFSIFLNTTFTATAFFQSVFVSPLNAYNIPGFFYFHSFYVLITFFFLYGVGLALSIILPFPLIKKYFRRMFKQSCCRCLKKDSIQLEETLPYRLDNPEVQPILF